MIIGKIKGYNVCEITTKKVENDEILSELKEVESNIKDIIIGALKNKGLVYGLKKKNVLDLIYVFENVSENDKIILELKSIVKIKEINNDVIKEFEDVLTKELGGLLTVRKIEKVVFNDKEILPNDNDNDFSASAYTIGISLGIIFGLIFDKLMLGIAIGCSLGLLFGTAKIIGKKDDESK